MEHQEKKLWFKAKKYGWGWTPVTWEGWTVTLLYCAWIFFVLFDAERQSHFAGDTFIGFLIPFVAGTLVLLGICYHRGEKPQWRWRGKN